MFAKNTTITATTATARTKMQITRGGEDKCLDGQEKASRGIDPSGDIRSKAVGGNDVVDMGMMTPLSASLS
jgi:hypothetical protein